MTDKPENEHIEALKTIRASMVEVRRQMAAAPGEATATDRIKLIKDYQEAIRALDEAIADERRLDPH